MSELGAQTRGDLEGMLAVAEKRWSQDRCCIQMCLQRHVGGDHYGEWSADFPGRLKASFAALGFKGLNDGYDWNDASGRTKDEVLTLIRNTLETDWFPASD